MPERPRKVGDACCRRIVGIAANERFLQGPRGHFFAEFITQAFLETLPRIVDGVFHVGQTLFHDREHVEIRSTDLAREPLAAGVALGTVTFAFDIERLLLIEPSDHLLQACFHITCDVAGLFQVFDHGRGEQANGG